ncbi:N-acetylglucosamine-6-phosphate deacetylase [Seongchinamella sediminis]|uniref:N-acetylglucosamine-6-phosphate deacetylase n=1 Tax=Seongchinamella sediminis TaxID=2283635 RepID=A0A3L7DX20_9GAMM|nr:N-acetylglucosamine-6-phosphate deacetylase [Seongchinamella sediminis]RLQ21325.1 N-acetylglucosamine-6-phosphate deacetylase [Seongchinamella sediminis]
MPGPALVSAICPRRLFDGDNWLDDHALLIDREQIVAVLPRAELAADIQRHELAGLNLAPGLIDIQVNGGGGVMFNNQPSAEGVATIANAHRRYGTTGIMPTVISDTPEVQRRAASAIAAARAAGESGVLGLHLEGPHFAPNRRGTHKATMIRPPAPSDIDWLTSLGDFPTMITLAPEHAGPGVVRKLSQAGLLVCAGHTDASYQQISAAIAEGLRGFTHLFNAMSPLQGRAPGTVGAALDNTDTWAGIIADGHHVDPAAIRIAHRAKGPGKLLLVSDAMSTVGGPDSIEIYGECIKVDAGRLVNAEGNLAGSAIALFDAVRIAHLDAGLALEECLRMASRYPAQFLGLEGQLGRLAAGYRADLFAFDNDYQVSHTWVAGEHQQHAI